jgi:hypothetical protein
MSLLPQRRCQRFEICRSVRDVSDRGSLTQNAGLVTRLRRSTTDIAAFASGTPTSSLLSIAVSGTAYGDGVIAAGRLLERVLISVGGSPTGDGTSVRRPARIGNGATRRSAWKTLWTRCACLSEGFVSATRIAANGPGRRAGSHRGVVGRCSYGRSQTATRQDFAGRARRRALVSRTVRGRRRPPRRLVRRHSDPANAGTAITTEVLQAWTPMAPSARYLLIGDPASSPHAVRALESFGSATALCSQVFSGIERGTVTPCAWMQSVSCAAVGPGDPVLVCFGCGEQAPGFAHPVLAPVGLTGPAWPVAVSAATAHPRTATKPANATTIGFLCMAAAPFRSGGSNPVEQRAARNQPLLVRRIDGETMKPG